MDIIKYKRDMDIQNLHQLPRGLRCPYLEVIKSHIPNTYIAKRWHRVIDDLQEEDITIITF